MTCGGDGGGGPVGTATAAPAAHAVRAVLADSFGPNVLFSGRMTDYWEMAVPTREEAALPEPIVRESVLRTSPEALYAAFADPLSLCKWFAQTATLTQAFWRFAWPGGVAAAGRILEADPPRRLVWVWEESIVTGIAGQPLTTPSQVTLTYTFDPVGAGTRFTIREAGHATEEIRELNVGGIDQMMRTLRAYLEEGRTIDWENTLKP